MVALKISSEQLSSVDELIGLMLKRAGVPGGALAIVLGRTTLYSRGFGYRDVAHKSPVTPETVYPIASTTKPINATLLAMLAQEGRLDWDTPVRHYLPQFALRDPVASVRTTVRDLVTMRTGLPRHDWLFIGNELSRAELVAGLAHLEPSADFRQCFQYCNLTATAAGHVAEIVTGERWESLVRSRILRPLGMRGTRFARPARGNVTCSYHENRRRQLVQSPRFPSPATAPSGGAIHSTVTDMARWVAFNLGRGSAGRRRLIDPQVLAQIHAPQVVIGERALAPLPADASYGLGWVIQHYQGELCLSHGGNTQQVNSSVMFFPKRQIGFVSFTNFASVALAELMNLHVFDLFNGSTPVRSLEQSLAVYEEQVARVRARNASQVSQAKTRPSHPLRTYTGTYRHAAYGEIKIQSRGRALWLSRPRFTLPLKHWRYETWLAKSDSMWPVHQPHAFDGAHPIQFEMDACGDICALSIPFEPEVAPIRFEKEGRRPHARQVRLGV